MLAEELRRVAVQDHAIDDGEIAEGLFCIAVPIRKPDGSVPAAISVSRAGTATGPEAEVLGMLRDVARSVESTAFGS